MKLWLDDSCCFVPLFLLFFPITLYLIQKLLLTCLYIHSVNTGFFHLGIYACMCLSVFLGGGAVGWRRRHSRTPHAVNSVLGTVSLHRSQGIVALFYFLFYLLLLFFFLCSYMIYWVNSSGIFRILFYCHWLRIFE